MIKSDEKENRKLYHQRELLLLLLSDVYQILSVSKTVLRFILLVYVFPPITRSRLCR